MTHKEAVNWLINLAADICKVEHRDLWHYEQALTEIREILETEDGWIPCSERLPEPEGHKQYLITEAHYNPKFKARHVDVDEYEARDPENPPYWVNHREDDGIRVTAWQPMPEPWKGNE